MSAAGPVNVAAHLPKMASLQPTRPAIIIPSGVGQSQPPKVQSYSFSELENESNRYAAGLESVGIRRGIRTVLMVPPGFDFFVLTFALFKVGAVPVLVDPGMGVKNLKACLGEAEPEAFIGVPKAHLARLFLGWAKPTLKTLLTVGKKMLWGGMAMDRVLAQLPKKLQYHVIEPAIDDTAAILFTSGSTGVPKGAVYSHGNFSAQVEALRALYDIQPGEIDLPTFPLFALFAPALGMTAVVPEMDFTRPAEVDPVKILRTIDQYQVTTMFGSPALINKVGRYAESRQVTLPSLKRVISAGAPVSSLVLERFEKLLPDGAQVFTPYGATEALPVCSIGSREILTDTREATDQGHGVCIGRAVPGVELAIIHISDEPIECWSDQLKVSRGEIGEIVVKGPQVTRSYYNRVKSTCLSKIQDLDHGGFYHRMGDLGYQDEQGRLWFCGRKSHRVVTQETTLFTIPCEAIFNTHTAVFRTALVGLGPLGDQIPVLCVELEQGVPLKSAEKITRELLEIGSRYAVTQSIQNILFHPRFPVDIRHNAKIFREKLAVWAEGKLQ